MKKITLSDLLFRRMMDMLEKMKKNPDKVTDSDRSMLEELYSCLCRTMGVSEHSQWRVEWRVEKWKDTARKLAGFAPDEVAVDTQNIILDTGANEMLKLITGTGGTAFSSANSYIYVGTDDSAENAAQTGIIATGSNRAFAVLDTGYPTVSGRQMIYRASFSDDEANFPWKEVAIYNGNGTNAVCMNRKVVSLGKKETGTWSIQITVSLTSNA